MTTDVQDVLKRAKTIVDHGGQLAAMKLSGRLANEPQQIQENCHVRSSRGGFVFLYRDERITNNVLELIQAGDGQDNVMALYEPRAIFNDRVEWMKLRIDIIDAIEDAAGKPRGSLLPFCNARQRHVLPGDLTTIELRRMLEKIVNDQGVNDAIQKARSAGLVAPIEQEIDVEVPTA